MFDKLKTLKDGTVASILMVVLGAFFLLMPGLSETLILRIGALLLIAAGVSQLLGIVKSGGQKDFTNPGFLRAVVITAVGVALLILPGLFASILPMAAGVLLVIAGVQQLLNIFRAQKEGAAQDWKAYIVPAVTALAGILVFLNPFSSVRMLIRIIGGALIWYGATSFMQRTKE